MKSKGQSRIRFFAAVLLIGCIVLFSLTGLGSFGGILGEDGVVLGLDLVGGSRIVYAADVPDGYENPAEDMQHVLKMLRARLDMLGYTEATATSESTDNRIVVEIPSVDNPEQASALLGASALLTFADADGNTVLSGTDVAEAKAVYGSVDETGVAVHYVSLTLTDEAVQKFADATAAAAARTDGGNYISICLDGNEVSSPLVHERIESKSCIISGNYTAESASYLAGIISAGSLPFALKEVQMDTVGATLGERALTTSLTAGSIGILLVMLFMLLVYRLPGLIASLALACYCGLMGLALCLFHVNLSLPGIAGIILSVGMAVDANVVVFERIKEELRSGRSTLAAFRTGFHAARIAVFDSNVTTLIAALVLWIFGSGTVKGFAVTLFIGVVLSMFTAMTVTRRLLSDLVGMGVTRSWLWGLSRRDAATADRLFVEAARADGASNEDPPALPAYRFSFLRSRRTFALVTACVVLVGILSFAVRGFFADVDFTGGTALQVEMEEYLTHTGATDISDDLEKEICALAEETVGSKVSSFQRAENGQTVGKTQFILKLRSLSSEERDALYRKIAEVYGLTVPYVYCSNVDGSVSGEFRRSAVVSAVVATVFMLLYITFRFDLASGMSAVVCLLHDLFLMLTAYSLLGIPLNSTMIAALLTILGYSINATIIVFDRVRENRKCAGISFEQAVEKSVHDTFARSVNTTITTFLTVFMLCLLGVDSIRTFALPLAVGIAAGFFSSVCLAGNLWCLCRKVPIFNRTKE